MTTNNIQKRVDAIKLAALQEDDPEKAHALEDDLRDMFIQHVILTAPKALASQAELVFSTRKIDFPRWCA